MKRLTWLGMLVGAVLALATSKALADCNCHDDGQCVYQTCCYMNGDCKPIGDGVYRYCVVEGEVGSMKCSTGGECSNGEDCDLQ